MISQLQTIQPLNPSPNHLNHLIHIYQDGGDSALCQELASHPQWLNGQLMEVIKESKDNPPWPQEDYGQTLYHLGNAYQHPAQLAESPSQNRVWAATCYRIALEIFRPQSFPAECLKTALALGDLGVEQGDWQMALDGYYLGIAAIEQQRTQLLNLQETQTLLAKSLHIQKQAVQAALNL
ncbi:hypothetical protein NEA10_19570 [Phormidium yuhuli AB48]|uniref:Tetratricopeptide repeat protein n=1 Tax=Phormidium yuhuli AB48 TaxID=2940671 RepID=A0ABY5AP67_9CYAN|nr:hypothetical protein [Phormidium yuhuli]USR90994.1 hypothetical protein NEA10_19570 [Phormidium yuhuli AB48]